MFVLIFDRRRSAFRFFLALMGSLFLFSFFTACRRSAAEA
jgi:hypothetical protein